MNQATPEEIRHSETGPRGVFFLERGGRRVAELTFSLSGDKAPVGPTYVDPPPRGGTAPTSRAGAAGSGARAGALPDVTPFFARCFAASVTAPASAVRAAK